MDKANIYSGGNQRKINPDWFTGKTRMKEIGDVLQIAGQKMYHVYFESGSRTKLHQHNGNQILIVTEGEGSLESFKKTSRGRDGFGIKRVGRTPLRMGDVAYVQARTLHTHGSTNQERTFSHIAINILPGRSAEYRTSWYESDFESRVTASIR